MTNLNYDNSHELLQSFSTSREDKIFEVLYNLRKDVFDEFAVVKKMLKSLQLCIGISEKVPVRLLSTSEEFAFNDDQLYMNADYVNIDERARTVAPKDMKLVDMSDLDYCKKSPFSESDRSNAEWDHANDSDVKEEVSEDLPLTALASYSINTGVEPVDASETMTSDQEDAMQRNDQNTCLSSKEHLIPGDFETKDDVIKNVTSIQDMFEFIGSKYSALTSPSSIQAGENKVKSVRICRICDKVFHCKLHLEEHLSVHTKEKRYKCLVCGNLFCTRRGVRSHVKRHLIRSSSRNTYKCDQCGKSFTCKNFLESHFATHATMIQPFECKEVCNETHSS